MRTVQRIISIGFATTAIAAGSMPALSGTVWPDVDFEWYANVGRTTAPQTIIVEAPRTVVLSSEPERVYNADLGSTVTLPEPLVRDGDVVIVQPAQPVLIESPMTSTLPATGAR